MKWLWVLAAVVVVWFIFQAAFAILDVLFPGGD